jgi:hypothetical protein
VAGATHFLMTDEPRRIAELILRVAVEHSDAGGHQVSVR